MTVPKFQLVWMNVSEKLTLLLSKETEPLKLVLV